MLPDILAQPSGIRSLIECPRCETHDSLRRVRFVGREVEAVEFKEENAGHETRPLVAVHKGMVADNARCVKAAISTMPGALAYA